MRPLPLVTVLIIAVCLGGCYDPDLGKTPFLCAGEYEIECPEGFECQCINYSDTKYVDERCKKIAGLKGVCVPEGYQAPEYDLPIPDLMTDTQRVPLKDGDPFLDGAILGNTDNCKDSDDEPNNSAVTATEMKPKTGLIPDWEICYKFDIDQFSFNLKTGQKLTVKVLIKSTGDLDAALSEPTVYYRCKDSDECSSFNNKKCKAISDSKEYLADKANTGKKCGIATAGKIVDTSRGTGTSETVSHTAMTDGEHILGVWGVNVANVLYNLEITVEN